MSRARLRRAACKGGKVVLTEKRETTGPAAAIRLTADRTEINADGEDVAVVKVEALDKDGRVVPTANNRLGFKVSGAGQLIGVGNGDPNCQESDKEPKRSLFNGLAQVIVQATKRAGRDPHRSGERRLGWPGADAGEAEHHDEGNESSARCAGDRLTFFRSRAARS